MCALDSDGRSISGFWPKLIAAHSNRSQHNPILSLTTVVTPPVRSFPSTFRRSVNRYSRRVCALVLGPDSDPFGFSTFQQRCMPNGSRCRGNGDNVAGLFPQTRIVQTEKRASVTGCPEVRRIGSKLVVVLPLHRRQVVTIVHPDSDRAWLQSLGEAMPFRMAVAKHIVATQLVPTQISVVGGHRIHRKP